MGRRGPGQWAGCEETAVARDLLPEDGRKWLRCLAGGGEEREGRAGPQGVEGVGPAGGWDPAPAWIWSWEGRGSQPGSDGRGPGKEPVRCGTCRRRGGSEGSECWEGLRVTVPWERRAPSAGFRREGWEELSS